MKKILYVGLLHNYGKSVEGFSYEHMNIEAGLLDCVKKGMFEVECWYPDDTRYHKYCDEIFIEGKFDAIFHVAFNESLDLPEEVARLALKQDIPVIQWDCDSSWRFHNWILPRKNRVSHFITTHTATVPWYNQNGMKVIKSQWAGSPRYIKRDLSKKYDVSFVGQKHGIRPEIMEALYKANVDVDLFGNYWEGYPNWHGYKTDFEDIIQVFNESKICLNLSNPWHIGTMPQIKGRHFEIPQCGGFQLCTPADDLTSYFVEGKEIVTVRSTEEMAEKISYYLQHDAQREEIAKAGRDRMLKDHQWSNRFDHIFKEVGIL